MAAPSKTARASVEKGSRKRPAPVPISKSSKKKKDTPEPPSEPRTCTQSEGANGGVINISSDADEGADEDAEAELGKPIILSLGISIDGDTERLSKKWTAPIYGFYHPMPDIEYSEGRRCHVFSCASKSCKYKCRRFLDKGDANSTGNLRKHIKSCWGEEALRAAESAGDVNDVREKVVKSLNETGSITAAFKRKGKGKVTYSNRQHTKTETREVTFLEVHQHLY